MPHTIQNFQINAAEIVQFVKQPAIAARFRKREYILSHGDTLGHNSRFSTLMAEDMPKSLIKMIFDGGGWHEDLRDFYTFIQIQRYNPGEYIVPHRDKYDIKKLHLVCLTTSNRDAFYVFEDDVLHRVEDVSGTKIEFQYDAVHFVPTTTYERYSLVIAE
jgi:hypothetical protein